MKDDFTNNILSKLFPNQQVFVLPETNNSQLNGIGSNQRGIIVLYLEEQQENLIVFLKKILQAAKIDPDKDIYLLGLSDQEHVNWVQLRQNLSPKHVMSFGISPKELGLASNFQLFKHQEAFGVHFLFCPTLSELENNKAAKGQLWATLQELFLT